MEEQIQEHECYDQQNYFVATLKCNKCSNFSNINLNPQLNSFEFEKIQNTYLCFYCSNTVNDFQNIMKYINVQINNMIHKNSFSFKKVSNKIEMLMSVYDDNKRNYDRLYFELKKCFDIVKIEYNTMYFEFKKSIEALKIENDDKTQIIDIIQKDIIDIKQKDIIDIKQKDIIDIKQKDIIDIIQKDIIDIKKYTDIKEYKLFYDKQLTELNYQFELFKKHVSDEMFSKEWCLLDKHTKQLHHIENRITNLNSNILIDEKKYEQDYKNLNEKLNEIIMKNQEYKDLKHLKKELMINKKEYNKFKEKINLFYDYLYLIYALIGVNIMCMILFIFDKFQS